MKNKLVTMPVLMGLMFASPALLAANAAIQEMAEIVLHLDHRPSASEKKELQKIINSGSATESERTIAGALMNMNHHVSADDRQKLQQIAGDSSAPAADRKVADILSGINHHPNASEKETLREIAE